MPDKDKGEGAVDIINTTKPLGTVVAEAAGTVLLNTLHELIDQFSRLVLLGESKAETGNGLGDVERLKVVVVIGAGKKSLIELLAGRVEKALPNFIAFFGGTE